MGFNPVNAAVFRYFLMFWSKLSRISYLHLYVLIIDNSIYNPLLIVNARHLYVLIIDNSIYNPLLIVNARHLYVWLIQKIAKFWNILVNFCQIHQLVNNTIYMYKILLLINYRFQMCPSWFTLPWWKPSRGVSNISLTTTFHYYLQPLAS